MTVAYFSMEIGLEPAIPTYAGGLGVLAGDALRSAADLGLPMVGVTLLHRSGYFRQHLDATGQQTDEPARWSPEGHLQPLEPRVTVTLEGVPVAVRAWRYDVRGHSGHVVPVFFLDAHVPENDPRAQGLTDLLYGGDQRYRLSQEALLGIGGVAMLEVLGYQDIAAYHMNEGHSALLVLALLERQIEGRLVESITPEDREAVRARCVFTTHTPVPAGMDRFPRELAVSLLGPDRGALLDESEGCVDGVLNMTQLALAFARYVNGVALRHGQVSQGMFPRYPVNSINNGVHAATWTSPPFAALFDRYVPGWRRDNQDLRHALDIPLHEVNGAHQQAKGALLDEVQRRTGVRLERDVLTLGFARRATSYKRHDLLFTDMERLRRLAHQVGPLQVIFAGKAHPADEGGKAQIRSVFAAAAALKGTIPVVYLEEYDMGIAGLLCAGADLWLNTPLRPMEASGTSGMKAAINGVPSLSVLDGWWVEGHVEGATGWSIGESGEPEADPARDALSLYDKLENVVMPMYYGRPSAYAEVMRSTIALNGSFFNAERMMLQYARKAYRLAIP